MPDNENSMAWLLIAPITTERHYAEVETLLDLCRFNADLPGMMLCLLQLTHPKNWRPDRTEQETAQ